MLYAAVDAWKPFGLGCAVFRRAVCGRALCAARSGHDVHDGALAGGIPALHRAGEPFGRTAQIYSYDIVIKAGFDFTEIEWEIKDTAITVRLPEAKILSSELKWDSFKLYHEDESIFKQIKMEENNEALKNLVQNAETDAVANGLLDNARSNAETILRGFFGNVYNLEEYEIRFINK